MLFHLIKAVPTCPKKTFFCTNKNIFLLELDENFALCENILADIQPVFEIRNQSYCTLPAEGKGLLLTGI
ncbi:hypothetical protein ASG14_12190 [Pedobacter sp. Leaf194]|nr:hypothetical protein ASG14_12190 [Pedobacter sp. Leaf194]